MNRRELIDKIFTNTSCSFETTNNAVDTILEMMVHTLEEEQRIEIRGFGSFNVKTMPPRKARNPKSGKVIQIQPTSKVHLKPGKSMAQKIDESKQHSCLEGVE